MDAFLAPVCHSHHHHTASVQSQDRIGFDLDEHFRVDERVDLHHHRRWRMRAEGFGVGLAELLPARDVGDEHASADYVLESGAQFGESAGDDLDTAPCLAFTISRRMDAAVLGDRAPCRSHRCSHRREGRDSS